MAFVDLILHITSTILIGYLSLTNLLAAELMQLLGQADDVTPQTVQEELADDTLTVLPSKYEYGGIIPSVLLEHAQYQQAAVGAHAPDPEDTTTTTAPQTLVSNALVNVFCQYKTDEYIRTTTGTGFFISKSGVILTNAHVAQFLLFEHTDQVHDAECTIRTGDPAVALYKAELLYLPPTWISQHADILNDKNPMGTGERDYALLYVSRGIEDELIPGSFPYIEPNTKRVSHSLKNDPVLAAGYPGEALYQNGADAALRPIVASTTVSEIYTFGSNHGDIFSIKSSEVGKHGASGGPIVNEDGAAIGLIVTKGNTETEGAQSLRGLTLAYVNRTIEEETGFSLYEHTQGDLARRGHIYQEALIPYLARLLAFEL